MIAPFGDPAQPNFGDISALVDGFRGVPGALPKPRAQLQANLVDPAASLSFADISAGVDAFRGLPYPFAGPGTCP